MTSPDERTVEVYADVTCPFTYVGLRRFMDARARHGTTRPRLRVRAWPLELVNGIPLMGAALAPEVAALRAGVAPALFAGFDLHEFPETTLPALTAQAAAYRAGLAVGEAFALAVRGALFEDGADIGSVEVIDELRRSFDVPPPTVEDHVAMLADLRDGRARGVVGSPHWFVDGTDFFCPTLHIEHVGDAFDIGLDPEGLSAFERCVFDDGTTRRTA